MQKYEHFLRREFADGRLDAKLAQDTLWSVVFEHFEDILNLCRWREGLKYLLLSLLVA